MRLAHVEARLEQQVALNHLIASSYEDLTKVGLTNLNSQRIQARLAALKDDWEKFSIVHEAIGIALQELSTSYYHHAKLPRIEIPKFNGNPEEWLSFKDLFTSLVIANRSLSAVEKIQYLKTSLVGNAAQLLRNMTITGDNFQRAWETLIAFYENTRMLVNSTLNSLLNLKRMSKESAQEMELLYTNIMQIYRSLENLQRPVGQWDDFLVFVAVQRLDSESVKAWEQHLGSTKEPPTWKQFTEFLLSRLRSLQAFEKTRHGKFTTHPHKISVKTHIQGINKADTC
ncbi:hypothetical protein ALC57_15704 [Trachymyrmex cornetzi]|uniref:Gag-Pol polyprotein n=1 Tax=Trachymyrmex cornetzi TaxID=471704 RepID=A0A151IWE3_9HYME|nr:hypothetical protein ALC57_15704 [Trachymyrmex cornetzi]